MTTTQHPIDYALDVIGMAHRNYRAVPTADETALRDVLASLDQPAMPPEVEARITAALQEARRG